MNRYADAGPLTVLEAAEALKVSPATIRRMVKDGRIKPMDLGIRHLRFSRREIERILGL